MVLWINKDFGVEILENVTNNSNTSIGYATAWSNAYNISGFIYVGF
jgi:hypothetical protein